MAPLTSKVRLTALGVASVGALLGVACSPEARRVRDGGQGGDPGNKRMIESPVANPRAADTTLWPGRAPSPEERLTDGTMKPPTPAEPSGTEPQKVPPSKAERPAFTKSAADPRTGPEHR